MGEGNITNYHPYFVLLFLDWRYRLDRAWYLGYEFPQNYLQVEYLDEMPGKLAILQQQSSELLTHIWVTDTREKSVDEKMTAYLSKLAINAALFCWGVVAGRPKSTRAPMAHFTSRKAS